MTKAEERALEAYPRDENDKELNYRRANYRIAYERGYEQAEKDMIERACNYLYDHRQGNRDMYQFIGLFRKAMEEGL